MREKKQNRKRRKKQTRVFEKRTTNETKESCEKGSPCLLIIYIKFRRADGVGGFIDVFECCVGVLHALLILFDFLGSEEEPRQGFSREDFKEGICAFFG